MLGVTLRWTSIPSRGEYKYSYSLNATETGDKRRPDGPSEIRRDLSPHWPVFNSLVVNGYNKIQRLHTKFSWAHQIDSNIPGQNVPTITILHRNQLTKIKLSFQLPTNKAIAALRATSGGFVHSIGTNSIFGRWVSHLKICRTVELCNRLWNPARFYSPGSRHDCVVSLFQSQSRLLRAGKL